MSGEELAGESPWLALQQAREAVGITQREVADALHLPISTIDAIECGDKSRLPADVFTRGYVRAYAKLLELDPEPLVTALTFDRGEVDSDEAVSAGARSTPQTDLLLKLKQPPVMIGAAAAVVVVVLLIVMLGSGDESPANASVTTPSADEPAVDTTDAGTVDSPRAVVEATAIEVEDSEVEQGEVEEGIEAVAVEAQAQVDEALEAGPDLAEAEPYVADAALVVDAAARRLTPGGDDRLALVFSEDCWVEIKDAAGVQLFGDLGRAGQTLEFVGSGPFRVLLGYAPGVVLLFNAEPIALTPHTRNNVANLVLGQ